MDCLSLLLTGLIQYATTGCPHTHWPLYSPAGSFSQRWNFMVDNYYDLRLMPGPAQFEGERVLICMNPRVDRLPHTVIYRRDGQVRWRDGHWEWGPNWSDSYAQRPGETCYFGQGGPLRGATGGYL